MYCLGIDTSCYTTSIAAVDQELKLCHDGRTMLEVPSGGRGLRQSDAFFQHTRNMSRLLEQCLDSIDAGDIRGIAVSTRPRSKEGSYMPVFMAGYHTAKAVSLLLKVPVFEVSHQDSHIEAGIWSSGYAFKNEFLAYHISGGTTELLHVDCNNTMKIEEIGGSSDLKAGQFIDRAGVAMGLGFPCGRELDRLCCEYQAEGIAVPVSIDGSFMSFSGPEAHVQRFIKGRELSREETAEVGSGIFRCIAESIEKTAVNAKQRYDVRELLLVGGVASNTRIREYLTKSSELEKKGIKPVFSDSRYSSDNAAGTAVLGMRYING
jgi:N6-L-threonylcarbamoyladenine synthase